MKQDTHTRTKQLGFYVNTKKCIGCFSCAMACKNQYHQPVEVLWRKVYHLDEAIYPHRFRGYYSLACNHCEHPACLKACPVDALELIDILREKLTDTIQFPAGFPVNPQLNPSIRFTLPTAPRIVRSDTHED